MARDKKETGPERIERLVKSLKKWQEIERKSIEHTGEIMEQTSNPLVRQIMEIIRNDSVQHHRVQQFIIDSMTTQPVSLSPDDLAEVWTEIEKHDEMERETIAIAEELRDNCTFFVQRALLDYLLVDEKKHDEILGQLEQFKKNLYPYG